MPSIKKQRPAPSRRSGAIQAAKAPAPKFLLASGSPRRHELLQEAGYFFEVAVSSIPEISSRNFTIRELTAWNATRKALAIARQHPQALVLGADTLVALESEIIGKPGSLPEAVAILQHLSGRTHQVCTGVFLCRLQTNRFSAFQVISRVRLRPLSLVAIQRYFENVNPLDKAGAYAAQARGPRIIESIAGSFSNVVGLPMEQTAAELARFGILPESPSA